MNTFPVLLRQLAETLSPRHPRRTATEGTTVAEEHGSERVRVTDFRLEDVVTEYRLLRISILEVVEEKEPLPREEKDLLNSAIDDLIMKACGSYRLLEQHLREQFFANLAHDLRGPLSTAKSSTQLILRQPTSPAVSRWAERTAKSIDRMDRMIRDLLDAMRGQAGRRPVLKLEECDLVDIARKALEPFEADNSNLSLLAAAPVTGFFDQDVLLRAIENLASNAVKYGEKGRKITVKVRAQRDRALFSIHNHGTPIPPEQQAGLFRTFERQRGTEGTAQEGWGIGLAQARSAAESHGGSLGVESLPEKGTTFVIDIPLDSRDRQQVFVTTDTPP